MRAYMKSGSKHISVLIFYSFYCCSYSYAQVSVRANIDKDNILIGETISLNG